MFFGLFSNKKENRTKNRTQKPSFLTDYYSNYHARDNDGTAFSCIDRIASEIAMLNFGVFNADNHKKIKKHPIETLLKTPNAEENRFIFIYQSVIDYYNGGICWYPCKVGDKITALYRFNIRNVAILRDPITNRRVYSYLGKKFAEDELIFIQNRYSNVRQLRPIYDVIPYVFETADSLNAFTQNSFNNGIGGKRIVIDISKALPDATKEQIRSLKDSFKNEYSGTENAGRPLIKKDGIEYSEIGGNATDNKAAQLSENRKFQEHEISKIFGVPEELLNVSSSTNLENVFTLFSEFAIRPIATQIQEAINDLLGDNEYFEFDYNGILKVSMQQRIDAYSKELQIGILSPNEARAKENLEPIEAGDNHFMPVNLMPLNDETINAYMAKQKNEIANNDNKSPLNSDAQHNILGDDKA